MEKNLLAAATVMFVFFFSIGVVAQVPRLLPVQGQLTDSEGLLLDGEVTLAFDIYNAAADGELLWHEDRGPVQITDGFFSVYLGEETALDLDDFVSESELWLEMTVNADPLSRIRLASIPYALEAEVCHQIGDLTEDNMQSRVQSWATDACYNSETELTAVLNDNYLPSSYTATWDSLAGVPPELSDGTDATDDTVSYAEISSIVGDLDNTVAPGIHSHPTSNLVTVAHSGGDYASIQDAIDAIAAVVGADAATTDNPYLIWVAPGSYDETLSMQPYIHIQGAGQNVTIITSDTVAPSLAEAGTIQLADFVSLRDVTVFNTATGAFNVAIAGHEVEVTSLSNVTAQVLGAGIDNRGVYLSVETTGVSVTLEEVTVRAENGTQQNHGLYMIAGEDGEAFAFVRGGSYRALGGTEMTTGILIRGVGSSLEATDVTASALAGIDSRGLQVSDRAWAELRGGVFTAGWGGDCIGIKNEGDGSYLVANNVTALGQGGVYGNVGLWQSDRATAVLHGGSFVGDGMGVAVGIQNDPGCDLDGEGVRAVGDNVGLYLEGSDTISTNLSLSHSVIEGYGSVFAGDMAAVTLHNSRLIGLTPGTAGTGVVSCVLVTRDSFISDMGACP